MKNNVEDIGPTKKKITVEVPLEKVQYELDRTVADLKKKARLKGFRPGKVPTSMIRRMFGPQIEQDVAQKLMNDNLPQALEAFADDLVSQPVLEESNLVEGEPFRFTVTVELKPAFDILGYEGLNLTREIVNVSDEMVDKRLEELRQAYATTRSLEDDRPVAEGDIGVVDYKSFIGGDPVEGGANPNYQVELGSGRFNPDFEAALVGMVKEESKTVDVKFPDDHYNPKLAGQDVTFEVTLIDVKEKVIPELGDEFVKDLGREGIESLDQLKEKVREEITEAETERVGGQVRQQAREKLMDLVEFDLPESLVGQEVESMVDNTRFNLQRSGLNFETMGMDEGKLREDYRPEAEKRIKTALILEKIAKDKAFEATDEDMDDRLMEVARSMGQTPETIRDIYNKNNMMESLKEGVLSEKTLKFIIDSANIEDTEPSADTVGEGGEE